MWYGTYEEAEEACKEKEKEYRCEFYVLEDKLHEGQTFERKVYWAQRKIK